MLYPWVPPIKKPWIIHMPRTQHIHTGFGEGAIGDIMSNWEWIQIKNHNVCTQVLAVSELCHMAIHMLTCATRYNINKTPAGKAAAAGHSYWEGK